MRGYMKSVVCLFLFIIVLIGINSQKDSTKPKFVTYDMDASDSKHYHLGDVVKIDKASFKILDYKQVEIDNEKKILLDLDIDQDSYDLLHDKYTFGLSYQDRFLLQSNCDYSNGRVYVVDISGKEDRKYNQIVISDNKTHLILAAINLKDE